VGSNILDEKHTLLKEMGTRSVLKCKYIYLQNAIRHFSFGNCLLVLMVYIAKITHKPCFLLWRQAFDKVNIFNVKQVVAVLHSI
jgi:hypothetical protein